MPDKDKGLYQKFLVERVDDPKEKHHECHYFVLDPRHDQGARFALMAYKVWARKYGYTKLADDLEEWLLDMRHAASMDVIMAECPDCGHIAGRHWGLHERTDAEHLYEGETVTTACLDCHDDSDISVLCARRADTIEPD